MWKRAKKTKRSDRGFSLLEVVTATAVLSLALPAASLMSTSSLLSDADVNSSTAAFFLANSLMNEISERRFEISSSYAGNTPYPADINGYVRTGFQAIGDYNIYTKTWGALSPPRDETGAQLTNYANFSQMVSVVNVAAPDASGDTRNLTAVPDGSTDFKLVTVTIGWQQGKRSFVLSKVFAKP